MTVKSANNIAATFDAKDQVTKIVLPDGTTLSRDALPGSLRSPQTLTVSDALGKTIGSAQNVSYDSTNLLYRTDNGQTLVAVSGSRMITENLLTGEMRSKTASDHGIALPTSDPVQQLMDADLLSRGARSLGIQITRPRINPEKPTNSYMQPI